MIAELGIGKYLFVRHCAPLDSEILPSLPNLVLWKAQKKENE